MIEDIVKNQLLYFPIIIESFKFSGIPSSSFKEMNQAMKEEPDRRLIVRSDFTLT